MSEEAIKEVQEIIDNASESEQAEPSQDENAVDEPNSSSAGHVDDDDQDYADEDSWDDDERESESVDDDDEQDSDQDDSDESSDEPDSSDTDQQSDTGGLDDETLYRYVSAGKNASLDDETIEKLVRESPQVLKALADKSEVVPQVDTKEGEDVTIDDELSELSEPLKLDFDDSDIDPEFVEKVVSPLQSRLEKVTGVLNRVLQEQAREKQSVNQASQGELRKTVDSAFDRHSQAYPVLGSSKNLSTQAAQERGRICTLAGGLMESWEKAHPGQPLDPAVAIERAIAVEYGDTGVSSVVAKIKKNSTRMSARPSSRHVTQKKGSSEDQAVAEVNNYIRRNNLNT